MSDRIRWYFDPSDLVTIGSFRDSSGDKYKFRLTEICGIGYAVAGGIRSSKCNLDFDLGIVQGDDAERQARILAEKVLDEILSKGAVRLFGSPQNSLGKQSLEFVGEGGARLEMSENEVKIITSANASGEDLCIEYGEGATDYTRGLESRMRDGFYGRVVDQNLLDEVRSFIIHDVCSKMNKGLIRYTVVDASVRVRSSSYDRWVKVYIGGKPLDEWVREHWIGESFIAHSSGANLREIAEVVGMHEVENPVAMVDLRPEWLGIWQTPVSVVRVTWDEGGFWAEDVKTGNRIRFDWQWRGPVADGWMMIEPAPLEARAHLKPRKTVNIGWDPFGEG